MIEKIVRVTAQKGIHMRPSMDIVEEAVKYDSDIVIVKGDLEVNAKSMMEVSMLAALKGEELIIRASGEDEEKAVEALEELIHSFYNCPKEN